MSTPPPVIPPTAASTTVAASSTPLNTSANAGTSTKPPLEPLTGFRSALEHTGVPRSVLLYKPRLPSKKWLVFWTLLGSVSYIFYDDRRKSKAIREEYLAKVRHYGQEPLEGGSMGLVRKVKVLAARWPEDDEADRGAKYFRKYLKPYLVAAGIDYDTLPPPLYGAISRQTRAAILTKRRQQLGLDPTPVPLSVPGAIDPKMVEENELTGGVILVGRPSLKEYLEGLHRGWGGGVDEWVWEKEVEEKLEEDGVFRSPPDPEQELASVEPQPEYTVPSPVSPTGLSFLSRPQMPQSVPVHNQPTTQIPAHLHIPPSPLPPQPPLLLVPWTNHLGFQQIPYMIFDFFTEHKRVDEGAKLAYALICGHTRPFVGRSTSTFSSSSATSETVSSNTDLDFDLPAERYYKNDFDDLPARLEKAKNDYYPDLTARLEEVRSLARGDRELTDAEKKSTKPLVTEDDLKSERLKKEMRWRGQVEGWGIVRKEEPVRWDEKWDGWLRVFRSPDGGEDEVRSGSGR